MNIEEAIKTAIELETKVRDLYKDAEEQATDPVGKRVFNLLVKEEQHHLDYLMSKLNEWQESGNVTVGVLKTTIPSKNTIETEVVKLKFDLDPTKVDKRYTDIELQMLRKALKVEQETSDFYKKMVLELPEKGQELFIRFVEIEEGHKTIVQAQIDSVTGLGYWFDMPEFNLASI